MFQQSFARSPAFTSELDPLWASLHPDRVAGGDRDHRNLGGDAAAGPCPCQGQGAKHPVCQQFETVGHGQPHVYR